MIYSKKKGVTQLFFSEMLKVMSSLFGTILCSSVLNESRLRRFKISGWDFGCVVIRHKVAIVGISDNRTLGAACGNSKQGQVLLIYEWIQTEKGGECYVNHFSIFAQCFGQDLTRKGMLC